MFTGIEKLSKVKTVVFEETAFVDFKSGMKKVKNVNFQGLMRVKQKKCGVGDIWVTQINFK